MFIYIDYERSTTKMSDLIITLRPILGSVLSGGLFLSLLHLIIDMHTYLYLSIILLFFLFFFSLRFVSLLKNLHLQSILFLLKRWLYKACVLSFLLSVMDYCHFYYLIYRLFRILFLVHLLVH